MPSHATTASLDFQTDSVEIKTLRSGEVGRWDDFVLACPEATFCHRAGWREVIESTFGHETHFLYAERGGRIEGVLPLGHINSRLFGNSLISSPFCVYGGIAADTEEAREALDQAAQRLAASLRVDYLEMRNTYGGEGAEAAEHEMPDAKDRHEDGTDD